MYDSATARKLSRMGRLTWLAGAALIVAGCSFLAPSEDELGSEYGHSPADASASGSGGAAGSETGGVAGVGGTGIGGTAGAAGACATGKSCNGACVQPDDPAFGCGQSTCTPCAPITNATVGCVQESCGLTFCEDTYLDADENPQNGCEAQVEYPTRGLRLHLIKAVGASGTDGAKVPLWEDQSGNGWDATQPIESASPTVLANQAPWYSAAYSLSLLLGPRTFDLSHGFTLGVSWGFSGAGTLLALETPAGLLMIESAVDSKLRLRIGSSSSLSGALVPQPKDMITILQQDETGKLTLLMNDQLPITMTPDNLNTLAASEVTAGGLGSKPDLTAYGTGWVNELMFYAHAPGEPPDLAQLATYMLSN